VYPSLYRLERQGLIESSWSDVASRRRRIYRLTPRGRRELARQRREWGGYVKAMQAALA
jgi:DNA-binding PadR family transcriptional regulator